MGLFGRGRGKRAREDESGEDEFAGSALDKLAERQDEMESVLKDFIGESKRRFEDFANNVTAMKSEAEKIRIAANRPQTMLRPPTPIVMAGNPQEGTPMLSAEGAEAASADLVKMLTAINTRLDRLEKMGQEKAEEEAGDPVEVVMREAYQDLRKKIAKDVAATFKASTFKIADTYRAKVKKAVLKETEEATSSA